MVWSCCLWHLSFFKPWPVPLLCETSYPGLASVSLMLLFSFCPVLVFMIRYLPSSCPDPGLCGAIISPNPCLLFTFSALLIVTHSCSKLKIDLMFHSLFMSFNPTLVFTFGLFDTNVFSRLWPVPCLSCWFIASSWLLPSLLRSSFTLVWTADGLWNFCPHQPSFVWWHPF